MIGIYHSKDMDGICSGAIMKLKYPEIKLWPMDYGQPLPENPNREPVIIADMSFPMQIMYELANKCDLTWIDHHKSAIEDFHKFFAGLVSTINVKLEIGKGACELTWEKLFPDEPVPIIVKWLSEYDVWKNEDKWHWDNEIMPLQCALRLRIKTPDDLYGLSLRMRRSDHTFDRMLEDGGTIYRNQKEQNKRTCKFISFEMKFEGLNAMCLNVGGATSEYFESVYDSSKHDLMIAFVFTGTKWTFTLYSTKPEIDCSVIAKKYGGGGHHGASQFRISQLDFEVLLHNGLVGDENENS